MHGRLTICLHKISHDRNMLCDPPSMSGDSDLRCLDDCVWLYGADYGMRIYSMRMTMKLLIRSECAFSPRMSCSARRSGYT